MKISQIDTVYQVTFMPRLFPVNVYLIEEKDSLTLIDTGLPFSFKGIMMAAKQIGKPIERILLTHAHQDHIGAAEKLKETLINVRLYISDRDNRLLMGDLSLDTDEPKIPIKGGLPEANKLKADVLLKDGDRIGSLLGISAPGHTPGTMVFLDTRNNSLIVGDAFQLRGGIAVAGQLVPLFPFPGLATWSRKLALQSAEKILEYKPSLLASGHGAMLRDPLEAMKSAISKAITNLNKLKE